jgi:hypothetical protein
MQNKEGVSMNVEDVVLVRATNQLPINGLLVPSANGKYLTKDGPSYFKQILRGFLKPAIEKELGRTLNLWEESDRLYYESVAKSYYPFTSKYNSTLSFSLNGLVPDDINNKFSIKNVAIIEPLKYHVNDPFISVDVIDTTIKGPVTLSHEAIIVINKDYYDKLSDEQKNILQDNYHIELFTEDLKKAVNETLTKYNYKQLSLVLNKEKSDIEESEYKQAMIEFENTFAKQVKASRLKLQYLYTYPVYNMDEESQKAAAIAREDMDKNEIITNYYQNAFYTFLMEKSEENGILLNDEEKFYLLSNYGDASEVLEKLIKNIINKLGLDYLKKIVNEFNEYISNNYTNNDEIIKMNSDTRGL